jgi:NAD(P)-dependent dehydrogenase (short-subunit alcohol dehydrogenase family)
MIMMEMTGRVAIITGASRGIGRQMALELARRGAHVAVVARPSKPDAGLPGSVDLTVGMIQDAGGQAIGIEADVGQPKDLERIVSQTVSVFGKVDILINNAADMMGAPKPIADYPRDAWMRQFDINVHAAFTLTGLVVPAMKAQGGGVIINVTSDVGDLVDRDLSASAGVRPDLGRLGSRIGYAATKAALNALTNASAPELAEFDIAVISLDPGPTLTERAELARQNGFSLPNDMHAIDVPVAKVVEILTSPNPLQYSGKIVRASQS